MNTALAQVLPDTIENVAKKEIKTGRPSKVTKETLQALETAWANGATDVQACFIAGITPPTLYDYQTKHPDYLIRKEALKGNIALNAKHTIARHVKKDPQLALDVIERLEKNEWSLRTEYTGADGTPISFSFVPDKTQIDGNNG